MTNDGSSLFWANAAVVIKVVASLHFGIHLRIVKANNPRSAVVMMATLMVGQGGRTDKAERGDDEKNASAYF